MSQNVEGSKSETINRHGNELKEFREFFFVTNNEVNRQKLSRNN